MATVPSKPPVPEATARRRRALLALFAHPDDEVFAAGLIATARNHGARVVLLTATRGSLFDETGGDRRWQELLDSCEALGVSDVRCLELADGKVTAAECAAAARAHWQEVTPSAVVTFGRDGLYGHHDHIAVTQAVDELAGGDQSTRVLHTSFSRDLFEPLRRKLRRVPKVPLDCALPLGDAAGEASVTVTLSSSLREQKLAALSAHRSQLPGGDPRRFLLPNLIETLLEEERYRLVAGAPLDESADPLRCLWGPS